MDLNSYQDRALSYRMETANATYAVFNLAGEVGELSSLMAKSIRDGQPDDYYKNVKKELGDILWHVAAIAQDNGFTLGDVAYTNIEKLQSRKIRNVLSGSGDNR